MIAQGRIEIKTYEIVMIIGLALVAITTAIILIGMLLDSLFDFELGVLDVVLEIASVALVIGIFTLFAGAIMMPQKDTKNNDTPVVVPMPINVGR